MDGPSKGGDDKRNAKRPATEMKEEVECLEDVPPAKRFKVAVSKHTPTETEDQTNINIFWTRIFIALVPDAYNNDRFIMPSQPPSPALITSPLLCIAIDMNSNPQVSSIKNKIHSEHGMPAPLFIIFSIFILPNDFHASFTLGYDVKKQIIWTDQLEILSDHTICPGWLAKTGMIQFYFSTTNLPLSFFNPAQIISLSFHTTRIRFGSFSLLILTLLHTIQGSILYLTMAK